MLSLPTLFLLLHLPQANLKSPLDFVLDVAFEVAKTSFEVAVAVSDAVEETILDEVEETFGDDARRFAEGGLSVNPFGYGKLGKLGKLASKSKRLTSSGGKTAVLKLTKATSVLVHRKGYSPVGKNIQIQIDKLKFLCDLVAMGRGSITCVDIIRDPTREVTARHQAAGFGDGKEKKAHLSGPGTSDSARALGIRPGDSLSLRTEIWVCVDDATCSEWKAPGAEAPLLKVAKPPRRPYWQ